MEQASIKFAEEALEQGFNLQAKRLAFKLLRSHEDLRGYASVNRKHLAWSIIGRVQLSEGHVVQASKQLEKMIRSVENENLFANNLEVNLANALALQGEVDSIIRYAEAFLGVLSKFLCKITKSRCHISFFAYSKLAQLVGLRL